MTVVPMREKILSENERIAGALRGELESSGTLALNFIGSPGAGKTAFLELTLSLLPRDLRIAVLTGDLQTENDAIRLARHGFPVRQITTAGACHLDAGMVRRHLDLMAPAFTRPGDDSADLDLLLIENVGNLVCPTSYDLGEDAKVVILSVCEGEDKPLKYPGIFRKAELMILTKIDLLPFVPFDVARVRENARAIHPDMEIIETSVTNGAGMGQWLDWLRSRTEAKRATALPRALAFA